jgi:hypothetical protein
MIMNTGTVLLKVISFILGRKRTLSTFLSETKFVESQRTKQVKHDAIRQTKDITNGRFKVECCKSLRKWYNKCDRR